MEQNRLDLSFAPSLGIRSVDYVDHPFSLRRAYALSSVCVSWVENTAQSKGWQAGASSSSSASLSLVVIVSVFFLLFVCTYSNVRDCYGERWWADHPGWWYTRAWRADCQLPMTIYPTMLDASRNLPTCSVCPMLCVCMMCDAVGMYCWIYR